MGSRAFADGTNIVQHSLLGRQNNEHVQELRNLNLLENLRSKFL